MSAETVYAYSIEELNRVLGPIQKTIHDSFNLQQSIMPEIQRLNNEFCQQKSANKSAEQRETVLKDLAAAYDAYMELKANVNEGAKVRRLIVFFRTVFVYSVIYSSQFSAGVDKLGINGDKNRLFVTVVFSLMCARVSCRTLLPWAQKIVCDWLFEV